MTHTPPHTATDEECEHEYHVLSYDADIDWDPTCIHVRLPGPWILLRCRYCEELTIRPYHPAYYVKYTVLPYLQDTAGDITADTITAIHRFIHHHPHLVYAVLYQELTQEHNN
jgi:hypothetical protein